MDTVGISASQPFTPETVVARVVRDASRTYGASIDETTLTSWAEIAVADLWSDSIKVTTFLPLLAMREVSALAAEVVKETASQ
ncbi:hypothetical protein BH23CHL5_BH23CHL5_15510 [soil metagenome]